MSLWTFQCPLAIAERCIFVWIIRALHGATAARHIILTVSRTVQFVRIITAVVLLVAFERGINTVAV